MLLCARHANSSQTHQVLLGLLLFCALGMPPAHQHIQFCLATRSPTHPVLLGLLFFCVLGMPPAHKHIQFCLASFLLCARHATRSQTHPVLLGLLFFFALGMPPAHKHIQFCWASCSFLRYSFQQLTNTSSFAWPLVLLCARHATRSQTHPVLLGLVTD